MSKSIPITLQEDYSGYALTVCHITRIRTKDGQLFGFTDLDVPLDYDAAPFIDGEGNEIPGDDFGMMTHIAENGGITLSKIESSCDLTVNNGELKTVPDDVITPEKMLAGLLDSAEVYVYRVNYMDLSRGHELLHYGFGDTARVSENVAYTGFRSMSDRLKETEIELWSKTCPHKFGGPKCPKTLVWVAGEVTGVDYDEPTRIFGGDFAPADNFYKFGILLWKTGDNAGKEYDVERNQAGTIVLLIDTEFAVQIGDEYDIRQDCSKVYDDGQWGCLYHWGPADRNLYTGACPDIPTADGGSSMVPGNNMEYET